MVEKLIKEALFAARVTAVAAVGFGLYHGGKAVLGLFGGSKPEVTDGEAEGADGAAPVESEAA